MSAYILMKILESGPQRYDRWMRILSFGRIDRVYDRLTDNIEKEWKVLDIGCGTGALTIKVAEKGASVKAIDINPSMMEIAKKRAEDKKLAKKIDFQEMGVAELGREKSNEYDAIISGLCFSELTENELDYTLRESERILKTGGLLIAADEVQPDGFIKKILTKIIRFPLFILTFVVTGSVTWPLKNLESKIIENGLAIKSIHHNSLENFIELIAEKPKAKK
jgi:ubiquinone/menaquinone biosynthesis C-methylase UbiE